METDPTFNLPSARMLALEAVDVDLSHFDSLKTHYLINQFNRWQ